MKSKKKTPGIFFNTKNKLAIGCLLIASAVSAQQNGLNNTVGSPNLELGGDLIRHTNVPLLNGITNTPYDLVFNGEGQFGVGNTLSAGALFPYSSKGTFLYDDNALSTNNTLYNTLSAYYKCSRVNGRVSGIISDVDANTEPIFDVNGILTNVIGTGRNIFGHQVNVKARSWDNVANYIFGVRALASAGRVSFAGYFSGRSASRTTGSFACGVYGEGIGDRYNMGGYFRADSANGDNLGVYAETRNYNNTASINHAIYGVSDGVGNAGNAYVNVGVQGVGDFAATSFGVAGFLSEGNYPYLYYPGINAGVYGNALNASGYITPYYAGYFDGDVNINGVGSITSGVWTVSDKRLKKEIKPLNNSSDIIKKLHPKSFLYNKENEFSLNVSDRKDYGIIAQELEEVLPELVRELKSPSLKDKEGKTIRGEKAYKVVNYQAFFGILIANAQEQQSQLDEQKQLNEKLQQQLDEQKQQLSELQKKAGVSTGLGQVNADTDGFSMSQNEPNPFTNETTIKYTLPQSINNASLYVYDLTGKQITRFALTEKGTSSITISSKDLSAGIYIYSIIANGKVLDSKRMIISGE